MNIKGVTVVEHCDSMGAEIRGREYREVLASSEPWSTV